MKKRLAIICVAVAALVSGCGQTPATVSTSTKPTNQPRVSAQSLTANGGMQIVAHDGDKEAIGEYENYKYNYSSSSAQSSFNKGVDWLETDVFLNRPSGILYMGHDEYCTTDEGNKLNLITDAPDVIDNSHCAERFATQLDTIGNTGKWMIEIKGDIDLEKNSTMTNEYRDAVALAVYDMLNQRNRIDAELITSMDTDVLLQIKLRAEREGKTAHIVRVNRLFQNPLNSFKITQEYIESTKALGFDYISAAVKDWTANTIAYAKEIGLQTMGWGWDFGSGRDAIEDNKRGIDLCVDFMLTENITDLINRDRTCKRNFQFTVNYIGFPDETAQPIGIIGKKCSSNNRVIGLDIVGVIKLPFNSRVVSGSLSIDKIQLSYAIQVWNDYNRNATYVKLSTKTPFNDDSGIETSSGEHDLFIKATIKPNWGSNTNYFGTAKFTAIPKSCGGSGSGVPPTQSPAFNQLSASCASYGGVSALNAVKSESFGSCGSENNPPESSIGDDSSRTRNVYLITYYQRQFVQDTTTTQWNISVRSAAIPAGQANPLRIMNLGEVVENNVYYGVNNWGHSTRKQVQFTGLFDLTFSLYWLTLRTSQTDRKGDLYATIKETGTFKIVYAYEERPDIWALDGQGGNSP